MTADRFEVYLRSSLPRFFPVLLTSAAGSTQADDDDDDGDDVDVDERQKRRTSDKVRSNESPSAFAATEKK